MIEDIKIICPKIIRKSTITGLKKKRKKKLGERNNRTWASPLQLFFAKTSSCLLNLVRRNERAINIGSMQFWGRNVSSKTIPVSCSVRGSLAFRIDSASVKRLSDRGKVCKECVWYRWMWSKYNLKKKKLKGENKCLLLCSKSFRRNPFMTFLKSYI